MAVYVVGVSPLGVDSLEGSSGGTANTQNLSATLSFSGAHAKKTSRTLPAAGLNFTGAQVRVTARTLQGGLSFAGNAARAITRPVSAQLGFTGAVSKFTARPLSGALSFVGAVTRIQGKMFAAALSFTGSQTKATGKALPGGLSFSGSANRAVQRTLVGGLSFVGNTAKSTARVLTGGLSFSGAVTSARTHLVALAAALGFSGGVGKSTQRPLSGSLSPSGGMSRATTHTLPAAALSFTGNVTKDTRRVLAAQLSFVGSHTKGVGKTLSGALSFVGNLATSFMGAVAQIIHVINPPVSGSVVAVLVVQLPAGPAIFYLLSYMPDEVPIGEVATFRIQLAGSDGSRPTPDLAPVARVLDSTGAVVLANTTMTNSSGVWSVNWTPAAAGVYSVEVRTAYSSNTVAAQIPVTVRPRFDPIALAVSDTLVSRM